MSNSPRDRADLLAQLFYRLIEILRVQQGSTWRNLGLAAAGKTSIIELDGIQLQLRAEGGNDLQIYITPVQEQVINFRSDTETLRDIMAGLLTIDGAVINGKIYVSANLQELIDMYSIGLEILADSAINPQLQQLWKEFDQTWSGPMVPSFCRSLASQQVLYDDLIRHIPVDVLLVNINY